MSKISERLKSDKPWAILGISRKHYESAKPWKKSNMSREMFESFIILLPHDLVQDMKLHASAEHLTDQLFVSIKWMFLVNNTSERHVKSMDIVSGSLPSKMFSDIV